PCVAFSSSFFATDLSFSTPHCVISIYPYLLPSPLFSLLALYLSLFPSLCLLPPLSNFFLFHAPPVSLSLPPLFPLSPFLPLSFTPFFPSPSPSLLVLLSLPLSHSLSLSSPFY